MNIESRRVTTLGRHTYSHVGAVILRKQKQTSAAYEYHVAHGVRPYMFEPLPPHRPTVQQHYQNLTQDKTWMCLAGNLRVICEALITKMPRA